VADALGHGAGSYRAGGREQTYGRRETRSGPEGRTSQQPFPRRNGLPVGAALPRLLS